MTSLATAREEEEKDCPLQDMDCNGESDDDDSQTLQTLSSPLVLDPLGMSISFHDERLEEEGNERHEEVTRVLHYQDETNDHSENADYEYINDFYIWWVLWRGPLLVYTVCFVLPTISSYVMHEDTLRRMQETYDYGTDLIKQWMQLLNHKIWCGSVCTAWKETIQHQWIEPALECVCNLDRDILEEETWKRYTSVSFWATRWNLCPQTEDEEEPVIQYRPVLAPDVKTEWKQDLVIVAALSTALTALRLLVVLIATQLSFTSNGGRGTDGDDKDAVKDLPENQAVDATAFAPSVSTTPMDPTIAAEASLPGSAIFRTVCCTASATMAWRLFHQAEFWPDFVLGQGRLDHCWDLIVAVDDDGDDRAYEQQNTLLRYYVTVQASYYVHSVTFRFIRWLVRRKRRTSLVLSLIQSVLALGLLALASGFSSLRRLVAIGMFALDVSSAVRHFWQVCAPGAATNATLARKALTQVFYWILVLPSFVATRFYVYPLLWYSATNAQEWRIRLEEELWKGSAEQFLRLCNACMVLLLLVSAFSLQRLVELGPLLRPKSRPRVTKNHNT